MSAGGGSGRASCVGVGVTVGRVGSMPGGNVGRGVGDGSTSGVAVAVGVREGLGTPVVAGVLRAAAGPVGVAGPAQSVLVITDVGVAAGLDPHSSW